VSDLQKLGRELDYFYEDIQELLPDYSKSIMYSLHKLFTQLIQTGTSLEEETELVQTLYTIIQDTKSEWRGILSEDYSK
jgi:hypothetical protein